MQINLLTAAWYGNKSLTLKFPENWDVILIEQKNHSSLTDFDIKKNIKNPIGTSQLSELVKEKKQVAILIDDIQRPTPTEKVIPFVLDELKKGGIKQDKIIIVMAVACHRPATKEDFIKKLGAETVKSVKTLSHDCTKDLTCLGNTAKGTPIYVNKFVNDCDFKVSIGGVYPHESAGFGGGVKIVHPGICGIDTVKYLHSQLKGASRGSTINNEFRKDMVEVAEKVGLDFTVNVLVNQNREISHLYAGHRFLAHKEAVAIAKQCYGVTPIEDADIVIANIYPFDTSLHFVFKGLWPLSYSKNGSSKVVIASCPEGLGYHALSLKSLPGWAGFLRRMKGLSRHDIYSFIARLKNNKSAFLLYSPYVKKRQLKKIYPGAKLFNTWESLIQQLESRHKKSHIKVAVYPSSSLQFPLVSE